MNIKTVIVGDLSTNCYIAYDPGTKDAVIIDPGADAGAILSAVSDNKLVPLYIIITHGHPDHYGDANAVRTATGAKILVHEDDAHVLDSKILTLRGLLFPKTPIDKKLKDSDAIKFGNEELKVLHTPGHSRGGICLYSQKDAMLFAGDTLFLNDHGRTDLPGSSPRQMVESLKRLASLPPETVVHPGHGPSTSIAREQENILKERK